MIDAFTARPLRLMGDLYFLGLIDEPNGEEAMYSASHLARRVGCGGVHETGRKMIGVWAGRRPRRWGVLAVAVAGAILMSGCTKLGTVCAPGTWAPATAEVTWSPGPQGTGSVPAVSCESAPK